MSNSETTKVFQEVINKAWDDDSYRAQLIAEPAVAIKSATGYEVPAGAKIVVVDETDPSVVHFHLPPEPNFDDMELTDEQLEAVAGGEFVLLSVATTWWISGIVSAAVTSAVASAAVGASQNGY